MSHRKKLTRRDFLKLTGTTVAAASFGGLLQGCAPVPTPAAPAATTAPAAAATTAPAAAATAPAVASSGKTVTLAIQAFAHDALKPVIAEWEQKSGYKVNLESGPTTGQEMMTKYAPAFQSNTSSVDVLSVDDVSGPAFTTAGWMLPLDDVIPAETWADYPASFLPPPDQDPFHSYQGTALPRAARVRRRLLLVSQGLAGRKEGRRAQDVG